MIKIEVLHPLLVNIKEHGQKEGISSYFLSQKMNMPEQRVRYYLQKCIEDGFIAKENHKYHITDDVFIQNGFAIIYDKKHKQFGFFGCPHYNVDCQCTGSITENCVLLKEIGGLPIVRRFLKEKTQKKEALTSSKENV